MAPSFIRAFELRKAELGKEISYKEEVVHDDRFSSLPEGIVHHILSFVDVHDMLKLSVVSKTCWELCLSNPDLNFNSAPIHLGYNKGSADPINLLSRLISERREEIYSFRLCWTCHGKRDCPTEKARLHAWIRKAVKCNVQKFNLKLSYQDYNFYRNPKKEPFFSIDSLLGCMSLRVLKLHLAGSELQMPLVVLGSLEKLSLQSVKWVDETSLSGWTSTCCPSLKKLELFKIVGVEIIENHTIEELKFSYTLDYEDGRDGKTIPGVSIFADNLLKLDVYLPPYHYTKFGSVKVSAPKLQALHWKGISLDYTCSENFKKLIRSNIIFDRCYEMHESSFGGLARLVNSIAYAKVLCLPIALFEAMVINGSMPPHFHNLEELNLYLDGWHVTYIKVISSLLSTMPNLLTLTIRRSLENGEGSGRHDWSTKVQALLKSKASSYYKKMKRSGISNYRLRMKLLKIEVVGDDDIKLADYFLNNADLFEEMTIFYLDRSCAVPLSTLTGTLATASSNVIISTVMKPIDIDRYF